MSVYLIVIGWFASGLIGGALIWDRRLYDFARHNWRDCPTPKACLGLAAFSVIGPFALAAGLIMRFVCWLDDTQRDDSSWWSKPICRRRKP